MLADHPWFRLEEVAASERSAGTALGSLVDPDVAGALPERVAGLRVMSTDGPFSAPLLFSALPSAVAREAEAAAARAGHLVVSNASAYRADADVPLVIPEINPEHLSLLERQRERWDGAVVTNPNCVVAGLATALAPLHGAFGLERLVVTTFQAISGAGRPGPSALDVVDNVLPFIPGEEEKIGAEPRKILGGPGSPATFPVDATAVRVPVLHGHTVSVSASFRTPPSPEEAREALESFGGTDGTRLPSSPERVVAVASAPDRPQPRLDRDAGKGQTVTVGRIRRGEALHLSFLVLAHNLVRGAAGAALLNGELCVERGLLERVGR
jgi:aspartate-semialdehyde dehydrogenase